MSALVTVYAKSPPLVMRSGTLGSKLSLDVVLSFLESRSRSASKLPAIVVCAPKDKVSRTRVVIDAALEVDELATEDSEVIATKLESAES